MRKGLDKFNPIENSQSVPENDFVINEKLQSGIDRYIDEAYEEHGYLMYLEPEEKEQAKAQALALAQEKLKVQQASAPNSDLNIDEIIFTSAHAALKEKLPWMYYEDLPGVETVGFPAYEQEENIKNNPETIKKMLAIIEENYKDKPAEFREAVIKSFRDALSNRDSYLIVAKKGDDILAFCRFDYHYTPSTLDVAYDDEGEQYFTGEGPELEYVYFGSVNLNSKFKNSKLGETLIQRALHEVLDDLHVPFKADCQAYGPTGRNYIEKHGFVANKLYDFHGVPSLEIEHPEGKWESKNLSQTEIIDLYAKHGSQNIRKIKTSTFVIQRYETNENPKFELLGDGYRLTRYFNQDKHTYCVFERFNATQKIK